MKLTKGQSDAIRVLRGLAILSVVCIHNTPATAVQVYVRPFLNFSVGLFLFLSGVVYTITGEWKGKKTKGGFIRHKLLSLGVPYIVFSVVYICINSFVGQANTNSSIRDILYIWTTPIAQYWYLYALFFLFCVWTLLSGLRSNRIITVLTVAISYLVPLAGLSLGCFQVVFYSALAFGLGTCADIEFLTRPPRALKCVVVALHVLTGVVLVWLGKIEAPLIKELMCVFGIYASILLVSMLQDISLIDKFLVFMNKYSFQTFLLHTIFTAGIRIVLMRVGIFNWVIHVVLGLICGLGFSVLTAKVAEKVKFFNFFFFPTKYIAKK